MTIVSSKWDKGRLSGCVLALFMVLSTRGPAFATPSTQIWNPSTDIQKSGTFHLGIDNYFSILKNSEKPYFFPTDLGVEVGLLKYLEVGVDVLEPTPDPLYFNFKLGIPEKGSLPAIAVGGFNFGTRKDVTNYNIVYGAASRIFSSIGRLTLGYYQGMNKNLFLNEAGKKAGNGLIATWDKPLTDKIWACIDYASGKNWYGSLSLGGSYAFSSNVSVIVGYVIFNNSKVVPNNTLTTQLDINL
jgi:hypothetical protein